MAGYCYAVDDGYPIVELDSDADRGMDSSEDEVDVILHGTPEQKRRLRRQSLGLGSSSEDEFEKEMAAELHQTMKNIQGTKKPELNTTNRDIGDKPEVYDNIYFDSDSDEEGSSKDKASKKHKVISNDELLYDPEIDNDNQRWIDQKRRKYQPNNKGTNKMPASSNIPGPPNLHKPRPLPHSDAVLNCPACMTVLCLDCQRHDAYKNQYRAMFVMNCDVQEAESLKFPKERPLSKKQQKKIERKQRRVKITTDASDNKTDPGTSSAVISDIVPEAMDTDIDSFHPVKCSVCTTEVGVFDKNEIYHFFNVLASHG